MSEHNPTWRGTAAELACEAARRLEGIGLTDQRLNERQVRYYVAEGVLTRPERAGREAMFGGRQLLELQVARLLGRDGWPLAKIAAWIRAADERALRDLIPERRGAATEWEAAPDSPDTGAGSPDPVADQLRERLLTAQRLPPHQVERSLRIQVPGVLELLLPESAARNLTPDQAEHIGRMVRDLLLTLRD